MGSSAGVYITYKWNDLFAKRILYAHREMSM